MTRASRAGPSDDDRDPALGEKVARCVVCGIPDRKGNRLYPGLWGYIHRNIDLTLCERCILAAEARVVIHNPEDLG